MAKITKNSKKAEQIWLARQVMKEKAFVLSSNFKQQASTAIITAFGLVIALAWKDVIVELVNLLNPAETNLWISAVIVTLIGVLGIALVSRWANKK